MKRIVLGLLTVCTLSSAGAAQRYRPPPPVYLPPIYRPPPPVLVVPQIRVYVPPPRIIAPAVRVVPPPPPWASPPPSDWGCEDTYRDANGKIVRRCPD